MATPTAYQRAAEAIGSGRHVVAFTGAGVSVESGIPPFRGAGGLWNKYDPESLEIHFFLRNPEASWRVIREVFYETFAKAEPNAAHIALAELENRGLLKAVITQNIDNLHQRAGSRAVVEFHGNSRTLLCVGCAETWETSETDLSVLPPTCRACGAILKPDFVFFGEPISHQAYARAFLEAERADVMLVIGTTGEVMPAALVPRIAKSRGATLIEINPAESNFTRQITDIFIEAKAAEALPRLLEALPAAAGIMNRVTMNRLTLTALIWAALAILPAQAAEPGGGLSPEQARSLLQSVRLDAPTRAAMNAVTNNDIKDLVLNREITAGNDDVFSFSLPTKGITDQENTGRCWLFAGMNMLRQGVVKRYKLEDFELSQSYLAFWDRLEKSNVFLEFIIETRARDLLDRELDHMLDDPVSDGGYWGYVVGLVEKYGVLPKKFMGETKSSSNTERMDRVFQSLLRHDAAVLRELAAQGKPVEALREEKMKILQDVMRLLVINYGEPPGEFLWRVTSDSGVVTETHTYTPLQFYREVVVTDLADYVSLADFPVHPYGQHYSIRLTKAMADRPDIDFVNVDVKRMKEIALAALLDSQRVWFGCDMGFDVSGKKGLMVKGLVDYESLFGVPLGMTKTQRLLYRHSSSNHAMVLTGVDIVDGKPRRWRVENSWGDERGDQGFFTMSDDWFDEYVLNVIVPRKYVPQDLLAVLRQPPTELPVWDPSWQRLRW